MAAPGPAATPFAGRRAAPVTPAISLARAGAFPYLGAYLLYLATVARAIRLLAANPAQNLAFALLAAYGLLLVLAPRLTAGRRWRAPAYLLLQAALVVAVQAIPPRLEILSTLFVPLSLQAVLLFGRKGASAWIAAFVLAIVIPVTHEFGWNLVGFVMVVLYGTTYVLIGYLAALIQTSEAARGENERLIGELRIAHARLAESAAQAGELASAQERRRMARELHDSATQTIFGMNMAVQTARMLLLRQPGRVPEQLDRLQQLAQAATAEIQALAQQLQPLPADGSGFGETVRRLAAERAGRDGLDVRVEIAGRRDLPLDVQAGLCGILQEALNNVTKHAGARAAWVRLNLAGEPAWLEVEDQGAGFDPGAIPAGSGHLGLAGMAERAREIGWEFRLDTRPGQGTRIRVEERQE